jgi:signal transduction histidine kinase
MVSVAKQIEIAIEQSRIGAEKFQEQIGNGLRMASIAAQYALDPDVEKVTNEQLMEVRDKLGIQDITLLKRTKDNILLYKSSDPDEQTNVPTKSWDPWYKAFNQLFQNRAVTIDWGQPLKNFWTGPFEVATTDTSSVRKWGYYYDGTTNYIIDPYVNYAMQEEYEDLTGVNRTIKNITKENPTVLEITAVNPDTFALGPIRTKTTSGKELDHITQAPIIYGDYRYQYDNDIDNVKLAYESNKSVTLNTTINGKHVLKKFLPVSIDKVTSILDRNGAQLDRYVLIIVSDYATIQETLDKQFINIGLIILLVTLLSMLIVWIASVYLRQSRDSVVREAQETYVDEINQLFNTIRAQRHDFLNHVQTLHSLAELGKLDDLKAYSKELTGEIRVMNDIISIGNPAIAALVRSKISQAESRKIRFTTNFYALSHLELGVKSLDLTRLIGNLVDNAFDEVLKYPEEQREVSLEGSQQQNVLVLEVANYSETADKLTSLPVFEVGFSTKGEGHQGLGLSIVKSIVEQYKGTVSLDLSTENQVRFIIKIPV